MTRGQIRRALATSMVAAEATIEDIYHIDDYWLVKEDEECLACKGKGYLVNWFGGVPLSHVPCPRGCKAP